MVAMTTRDRPALLWALTVLLLASLAACSSASDGARDFELTVDLQRGALWQATGDAVDEGIICAQGTRVFIGWLDAEDGRELSFREWWQRVRALQELEDFEHLIDYHIVVEHSCSDGSGSFTFLEDTRGGGWHVVDGRGAYTTLSGTGTATGVFEPPTEPDHPPGGIPVRVDIVGELQLLAR